VGAALAVAALLLGVAAAKLDDVVQPSWANDHVVYDGDLLMLRLDPNSGSFGARISASRHPSFFFLEGAPRITRFVCSRCSLPVRT
jgi:hypothetical protein